MAIFTPKERQELEANDTRKQELEAQAEAAALRFELSQVIDTKFSQANALITALYNRTYPGGLERLEKLEDMEAIGKLAKEIRALGAAKQAI